MSVVVEDWLKLIEREYVDGYISKGGSAVKFVVGAAADQVAVSERLHELSERHDLLFVPIDAVTIKLHMIQDIYFAVANKVNWEMLAQICLEKLLKSLGYVWPTPGHASSIENVAEANDVDAKLLRFELDKALTRNVMRDRRMAQDFRAAMTWLARSRLEPEVTELRPSSPLVDWLCGNLPTIGALRPYQIGNRITRHNGRAMLRSLCHWLRICGRNGTCLVIDIRQVTRTGARIEAGLKYSAAAVLDVFEVLRQLIDDADLFEGLLVAVLTDAEFVGGDPKRSVAAYDALNERLRPDVHARGRDNPLAPMVEFPNVSPMSVAVQ